MALLSRDEDVATRADLALLRSEMADGFDQVDARFEELNATFHSYARMFVVVHSTTVLAVAGMVLGVTQLT